MWMSIIDTAIRDIRGFCDAPPVQDALPAMFIDVSHGKKGVLQHEKKYINLATTPVAGMLMDFDNLMAAAEYYKVSAQVYYLPPIDPLFALPPMYDVKFDKLYYFSGINPDRQTGDYAKLRNIFSKMHNYVLTANRHITEYLMDNIDVSPSADKRGYDLQVSREYNNAREWTESRKEWRLRTEAIARHLGGIFADVATVAKSRFKKGHIALVSDDFPSLKNQMDLITNCDNPSLLIE
jgi:hypothetical protein